MKQNILLSDGQEKKNIFLLDKGAVKEPFFSTPHWLVTSGETMAVGRGLKGKSSEKISAML